MIRIGQMKLEIPHTERELEEAIQKKAFGQKPKSWKIAKKSVDARKKPALYFSYAIDAEFEDEQKILRHKNSRWTKTEERTYRFPLRRERKPEEVPASGTASILGGEERPVIVGAGPSGLFAGLVLARNGFAPIILERGEDVRERTKKTDAFFQTGVLDEESNVQFGEGGAGTFSDGKLNTVVKDKSGRNRFVLEEFVRHGAPEEILYEARPHVGTDVLKDVVASIREEIRSLGGEVHFSTKMTKLLWKEQEGRRKVTGLLLQNTKDKTEWELPCRGVILAIGHSARDTFFMLHAQALEMRAKPFAIGLRVEHPADMINVSQYGAGYPSELPAASYKLTHTCSDGRGVYSFCMCPGGYVVNSSSEKGRLCVNGMSYHKRDGQNSNSAIIVTVTPEDFGQDHPLSGVMFQRKWEERAFLEGRGKIPVQLYGDFKEKKKSGGFGEFLPCAKGAYRLGSVRDCLPAYVSEAIVEGMEAFGKKICGYARPDAILSGVETRTSSPLRILRDESGQSNMEGVFPCGEGAGYAGGITSAAMDGVRMAELTAAFLSTK
ncbi:MAG: FAD-dependent oxidoreductase [Eubacteriales bacterium]|nr:FAD-dependent oxidoreductase [Eubacteriales bacterium]